MDLNVYSYATCSTCRKALKWLKTKSHALHVVDIAQHPPSAEQLKTMIHQSGLPIKQFFNTSGELYKQLQLKDKLPMMTEHEQLALLASHGKLIKRPIVTNGTQVTVGFKEPDFNQVWKHS